MRRTACFLIVNSLASVLGFSVQQHHSAVPRFGTSVAAVPGDAEIMSGLLVAGMAAAAYQEYRTDQFEAVKEFTKTHREQLTENIEELQSQVETLTEKVIETANEASQPMEAATKPAPAVVEEVKVKQTVAVLETPPTPAPKVESKPKPVAVTLERSKPVPPPAEDRTAANDLSDLVKKVGKTVEQNREMEDLVKARREKEMAAEPLEEEEEVVVAVPIEKEQPKKKRGILRKAWRVTKKVVAPWRKWREIS